MGPRRGVALALVLIMATLILALVASILQSAALRHRHIRSQRQQHQARWLIEAGLDRAIWALRRDASYQGESWQIPAEQLGGAYGAVVTTYVEAAPAGVQANRPARRVIRTETQYPADAIGQVRGSKSIVVSLESPAGEGE